MKTKVLAIVLMIVAFAANVSAQSVVYSFDFNEIRTNGGKGSIGFSKLKIYDNGTAHFEGYSFGGAKFDTTISIKKIEVGVEGSFVLYSAKGNNYKKQPFIHIGGLLSGLNLNAEVGAGGVSYLYISENEVYALSNFEFESNREKNEKQLSRMLNDYWNRRGIFRNYDGSSTPTNEKEQSSSNWTSLVGTKLTLGKYGLIGNGGTEANSFNNQTNEYMQLQSNGVLVWNNRQDGNTSYYYTIEGNKVYFGSTKGDRQNYFEIVSAYGNTIKTHDKIGIYRYFNYEGNNTTTPKSQTVQTANSTALTIKDILYKPYGCLSQTVNSAEKAKNALTAKFGRYEKINGWCIGLHNGSLYNYTYNNVPIGVCFTEWDDAKTRTWYHFVVKSKAEADKLYNTLIRDIKQAGIPLTKDNIYGNMSNRKKPTKTFKWVYVDAPTKITKTDNSNIINNKNWVGMYNIEVGVYRR